MDNKKNEVTFEIVESIGVIAKNPSGWQKELNTVSWNGGQAKYDIREWDPEHQHMSRGITLSEDDMSIVRQLLDSRTGRNNIQNKEMKDRSWER